MTILNSPPPRVEESIHNAESISDLAHPRKTFLDTPCFPICHFAGDSKKSAPRSRTSLDTPRNGVSQESSLDPVMMRKSVWMQWFCCVPCLQSVCGGLSYLPSRGWQISDSAGPEAKVSPARNAFLFATSHNILQFPRPAANTFLADTFLDTEGGRYLPGRFGKRG